MAGALVVHNLAALSKTFKNAPKDVRLAYRRELRTIANPVRAAAEALAVTKIRNLGAGSPWAKMRIGVTQRLVYVAPKQKGVRGRSPRGRGKGTGPPSFADLLATRAMEPALEQNEARIRREFEQLLDRLTRDWNRGP